MSIQHAVINSKGRSQKGVADAIEDVIHYILRQESLVNEMK